MEITADQQTINVIANQAIEIYQLKIQVNQLSRALETANGEKEREQAVPETGDEGTSQAQEEEKEE